MADNKLHYFKAANFAAESPLFAYGLAVGIFAIATFLRAALDPYVLPPAPFFTYYPAVLLVAFFCGLWPALFIVFISGLTAWYLFLPPRLSFELSSHATVALLAFFVIAGLIVAVVASLHAAIRKILAQEQETQLLAKELQHRTSNILTVIQSIAHRSLSGDRSLADGRQIFESRLRALARTHRQLTNSAKGWVSLEDIVRSELETFSSQTRIDGTEIFLDYQQAQKFSLALHELTTNALKHGALSNPAGDISIAWSVSKNAKGSIVTFRWNEKNGPSVSVPVREGFGSTLLKATFSGTRLNYAPDGFACEIEAHIPSDGVSAGAHDGARNG